MMKVTVSVFPPSYHYIALGDRQAKQFLDKGHKRIVCTINKSYDLHCAIMRLKEGGYYVTLGGRVMKMLKLKAGQEIEVSLKADTSEWQFEVPEEFNEVLETDPDASRIFNKLTDGNMRGIIYLVTKIKSSERRIQKALDICEKLKRGITSTQKIQKS